MALVQPVVGLNTVGQRWFHASTLKAQSPRPLINLTFHSPPMHKIRNSFSPVRRRKIGTTLKRTADKARAEVQASEDDTAAADMLQFKHVLLPIIDRNPYLTDGTKQAVATTTVLAKKSGAKVTVIVIDENVKDAIADHDARLSSIRWHLSQGGYEEFGLMERLGEGKKPTAVIGEVADDLNADLVVISMESIHSKHVDGNLLAEFIPCPVVLLPL